MAKNDSAAWDSKMEALHPMTRGANNYWYWKNKPEMEIGIASEVLTRAQVPFENLHSRELDPPDCEANVEGVNAGIEITELVHEKTLKSTLKGDAKYFVWDKEALASELQRIVDRKGDQAKIKGGPYEKYILIIVTDEFVLGHDDVSQFLSDRTFRSRVITDAYFALSYDPLHEGGSCPVFKLSLSGG
jgi:hypothetical protein